MNHPDTSHHSTASGDAPEAASPSARPPQTSKSESLPEIDVRERGAERDGQPQIMDRRLFMQFLGFHVTGMRPESAVRSLSAAMVERRVPAVIYDDVNDPRGIGVLTFSEDPAHFVTSVRLLLADPAHNLVLRPELTMLGRTYSTGYEQDLAFWLLERPKETVLNEAHHWAVWYPLRRSGAFAKLEPREQGAILREHGSIGRAYGAQDLAHDVRLACHGLDVKDNEFVIGLIGKDLHPLSHIVQTMRKTRQTSEFISQMGPFFVGKVAARVRG
jgi:chlorite dismutase